MGRKLTRHNGQIDLLSMEQRGLLLTAIMTYQDCGAIIEAVSIISDDGDHA